MSAIARNRNTVVLAILASLPVVLTVKNDAVIYGGTILAIDATPEALEASDTAALKVVGVCPEYVDNADDGEVVNPEMGCFKFENDATNPVVAGDVIAYVKDNQTVCASAGSTNKVVAGLVIAVDTDGVWMCMTLEGLKAAVALHAAGVASASNHIADPASAAALTASAPAALTASAPAALTAANPAAVTVVNPSWGNTTSADQASNLSTFGGQVVADITAIRAEVVKLVTDIAAMRTPIAATVTDVAAMRTPIAATVTDVAALRTGSEANNTAIDSILAALKAQEIVKTS